MNTNEVSKYIRDLANGLAERFGGDCSVCVTGSTFFQRHQADWFVHVRDNCFLGNGNSYEEALTEVEKRAGTPETVIKEKREQAKQLLADADALEADCAKSP